MDTSRWTPKQIETVGMLQSRLENFEAEFDQPHPSFSPQVVFTADGQDGPCMGFINADGSIDWMVEG